MILSARGHVSILHAGRGAHLWPHCMMLTIHAACAGAGSHSGSSMQQFPGGFGQAPAGTQFPYGQAPGGAPPAQPPQSAQPPSAVDKSLRAFWDMQAQEIELVGTDIQEFKNHQLPLARIKKVGVWEGDGRRWGPVAEWAR